MKSDKKSSKSKSNDGWDDVDWNADFSSNEKQKQPLVGNLVDLSEDTTVKDGTMRCGLMRMMMIGRV